MKALLWVVCVVALLGGAILWFGAMATEGISAASGVSLADPDDIQRADRDKAFARELEKKLAEHELLAKESKADARRYRLIAALLAIAGITSGALAWRRRSLKTTQPGRSTA